MRVIGPTRRAALQRKAEGGEQMGGDGAEMLERDLRDEGPPGASGYSDWSTWSYERGPSFPYQLLELAHLVSQLPALLCTASSSVAVYFRQISMIGGASGMSKLILYSFWSEICRVTGACCFPSSGSVRSIHVKSTL